MLYSILIMIIYLNFKIFNLILMNIILRILFHNYQDMYSIPLLKYTPHIVQDLCYISYGQRTNKEYFLENYL